MTQSENCYGQPSTLVFEREELYDDDDDDDDDNSDKSPPLNTRDVVFLQKQLKLVNDLHSDLMRSIKHEKTTINNSLNAIRVAKIKTNALESQSWSINSLLGRTELSDYIGL